MDHYSKKTLSMPVYSIQEGLQVGLVKNLLIDSKERAVIGLIVERRRFNREERYIPLSNIQSIGEDVITIDKAAVVDRRKMMPQIMRQIRNPFILIGARVFTVGGKILGKVEEYLFDGASGKITALEVSGSGLFKDKLIIRAQHITTLASGTIMVQDAALDEMNTENGNLRTTMENAMESAREKAGHVFTGTISASKKLSQNISQSFQKLTSSDAAAKDGEEAALEQESPEEAPAPLADYSGLSKEELLGRNHVVVVNREEEAPAEDAAEAAAPAEDAAETAAPAEDAAEAAAPAEDAAEAAAPAEDAAEAAAPAEEAAEATAPAKEAAEAAAPAEEAAEAAPPAEDAAEVTAPAEDAAEVTAPAEEAAEAAAPAEDAAEAAAPAEEAVIEAAETNKEEAPKKAEAAIPRPTIIIGTKEEEKTP